MSLANEERGGLVGAFIVEEGDEVLSITQGGQVVRSPINDRLPGDRALHDGREVRDAQGGRRGRRGRPLASRPKEVEEAPAGPRRAVEASPETAG